MQLSCETTKRWFISDYILKNYVLKEKWKDRLLESKK